MKNTNLQPLQSRIILRRIIQSLIILAIFFMAITTINHENDIFWQLRLGEQIWMKHSFPVRDPYSLPAFGSVWTLHEWIPSVVFYITYTYFGAPALIVLKGILVALTFAIFLHIFNKLKVNLYLSLLILALAALVNTRGIWAVFPSLFEYLFIGLTLYILLKYKETSSKIFVILLVFLSILWPNSHGSFFLFTGILAAQVVGGIITPKLKSRFPWFTPLDPVFSKSQIAALLKVALFSLVTPFLTPNSYWTFLYPFRISFGDFTFYVSEYQKFWQVWHFNWEDFVHTFAFVLIIFVILTIFISFKKLNPADLIMAAAFVVLAVTAVRHVAVFALVALYFIAKYSTVFFGEYRGIFKRRLVKDLVVIIIIVCFTYYYKLNIVRFGLSLSEDTYPKEAAELIMNNHVKGNMFNHYNYGGYLIWKMPGYKVFMDGRLEMYEGRIGKEYLDVMGGKAGYKKILDKYNINFFLIYITDPIVEQLVYDNSWKYVYHDNQYVVFVKNAPQNNRILTKYWNETREAQFRDAYKDALVKFRAESLNQQGLKAVDNREFLNAIGYFQEALVYDPNYITARMNLARTYIEFGLYTEAVKEYETILKIDPGYVLARQSLDEVNKALDKPKANIF